MKPNQRQKGRLRSKTQGTDRHSAHAARPGATVELLKDACREALAGHGAQAAALFRSALERDPRNVDAWVGLGDTLKEQGDLEGAAYTYRMGLGLRPSSGLIHVRLGNILRMQGDLQAALESCETGLTLDTAVGEGHIIRAVIQKELGHPERAIEDLRRVVVAHPRSAAIHIVLADTLRELKRLEEAATALRHAIDRIPDDVALYDRLAYVLADQRRLDEAVAVREALLRVKTPDAEAFRALAFLYQRQGRLREAFDTYQMAIERDPKFARAYTNLASLVVADLQLELGESIFRTVVSLTPDVASAHHNLGVLLRRQGQLEEATDCFRRALALSPDLIHALIELCHVRQQACDWQGLKEQQQRLFAAVRPDGIPMQPFSIAAATWSREVQLTCAKQWADSLKEPADSLKSTYAPRALERQTEKLRVGFLSSDFFQHATVMLIVELIETHDRSRFSYFAYSFGPDDGSVLRKRTIAAFDTFAELRGTSSQDAIRRIVADEIDILIDLKGYTQDSRPEIFAARPAPIQVAYLGYPATMGADFIDYIIADPVVAPMEHAASFTEKLVHLPHCYQPNDRKKPFDIAPPTREDCDLPPDGFVFCCFNNSYKINETMFDIWMRLLQATPGSVLWLMAPNTLVAANLQREAAARGIAPERLVFAPKVNVVKHLARLPVADLFLDTLPYNAHTTASEALWVGLPLLTCLGECFMGRVASSLLQAVGVPELITTSLADYEAKALALTRDPAALAQIRATLTANRQTAPLFDTARYARNFEKALTTMAALRDAGLPPEAINVSEETGATPALAPQRP